MVLFMVPFMVLFMVLGPGLDKNFFQEAGNGQVNSHLAAIISAVVRLLGGILAVFIVQRVERVRHAMTSMTIMGLSMITLGTAQLGYEALTQLFFLVLAQFWSFSEIPLEASCSSGMCQM